MLGSIRPTGLGAHMKEKFTYIGIVFKGLLHFFARNFSIALQSTKQNFKVNFELEEKLHKTFKWHYQATFQNIG